MVKLLLAMIFTTVILENNNFINLCQTKVNKYMYILYSIFQMDALKGLSARI